MRTATSRELLGRSSCGDRRQISAGLPLRAPASRRFASTPRTRRFGLQPLRTNTTWVSKTTKTSSRHCALQVAHGRREGEGGGGRDLSHSKDAALLEAAEAASLYDEPEEAHKQNLADFLATLVRTLHQLGGEGDSASEPTTNDASTLLPPLTALLTACAERELGEEQRGFLLRLAELAAALMLHPPHALLPPLAAHADAACRAFADVGIRALEGACAAPASLLPNSDALATAERALACIGMASVDAELDDESARDAVGALALALPDAAAVPRFDDVAGAPALAAALARRRALRVEETAATSSSMMADAPPAPASDDTGGAAVAATTGAAAIADALRMLAEIEPAAPSPPPTGRRPPCVLLLRRDGGGGAPPFRVAAARRAARRARARRRRLPR